MRDFFIGAFEKIIGVAIIIGALVILVSGIAIMFSPMGGFWSGLAVWIGGGINLLIIGGLSYLGLGIYHNTGRMADAAERQLQSG